MGNITGTEVQINAATATVAFSNIKAIINYTRVAVNIVLRLDIKRITINLTDTVFASDTVTNFSDGLINSGMLNAYGILQGNTPIIGEDVKVTLVTGTSFVNNLTDTVFASDNVGITLVTGISFVNNLTDTVTTSDNAGITLHTGIDLVNNITDTVTTSDVVQNSTDFVVNIADDVAISDTVTNFSDGLINSGMLNAYGILQGNTPIIGENVKITYINVNAFVNNITDTVFASDITWRHSDGLINSGMLNAYGILQGNAVVFADNVKVTIA